MRNLNIVDDKLDWCWDEVEKIEKFVEERNGKIMWGLIVMDIKKGKKIIEYLPWVTRNGWMLTPLKDIE